LEEIISLLREESKMLEEWIREKSKEGGANSWLRSKPVQYLVLILVCLGLLALIWPTGSEQKLAERPGTGLESLDPTQGSKQISQEVASILAKIEGAGKVDVSITLATVDGENLLPEKISMTIEELGFAPGKYQVE
jgi:copper chaperone CopZ